ncbi:SGNH/GDSL hydrolase family protein [Embleya sp. NPDC005971]|uniref:SGNH/GDSL hydrolase family protein n=1 Tax=unclassified Embleya TaxID=2699296 RepID=UPI00340321AD
MGGKRRVGTATAAMVAAVLTLSSCNDSDGGRSAAPAAVDADHAGKPSGSRTGEQTGKPGNPSATEQPNGKALVPTPDPPATATVPPRPRSMAALGDSITRGFDSCDPLQDCPDKSWATGTSADVNSHAKRLQLPADAVFNNAATGARMSDLAGQAREAVRERAEYVTILMGANDACRRTEAEMTSPGTFESQFRDALSVLREGLPHARVLVVSVPDLGRMWETGHDELVARTVWSLANVCQSMLEDPRSAKPDALDRRQRVRDRVTAYNAKLREVCSTWSNCRYDGGVVNTQRFGKNDVSHWDWFHPSVAGQRTLAEVTSRQGYTWG